MDINNEDVINDISEAELLREKYIEKYNKEELYFLVSILPKSKLIKPIKKYNKEFIKDMPHGFSGPDKWPDRNLREFYYFQIHKKRNLRLVLCIEKARNEYFQEIDNKITNKIGLPQFVRKEIQNGSTNYFGKIIEILMETNFKDNILFYFKCIELSLSDAQKDYLKEKFIRISCNYNEKKEKQLVASHVKEKKELQELYKKKIQDVEMGFNVALSEKKEEIKLLKKEMKANEESHEIEMASRKSKIANIEEILKIEVNAQRKEIIRLEKKIEKLTNDLEISKAENNIQQSKMKELSLVSNGEYEKFNKLAKEKWTMLNQHVIDEKFEIEREIEIIKIEKETILDEINALNKRKDSLESQIELVEDKSHHFIENIRSLIGEIGITQNTVIESSNIYITESSEINCQSEIISNKEDFIELLQTNLEASCIDRKYSFDLAHYIVATFANDMALLLVGYNARRLADAISTIVCGSSADVITLPLGFNDCKQLIAEINQVQSKVVLVENAVDNISENIYLPVIKQNKDKFLIFSMESCENVDILPTSILNYMMPVDIDTIIGYENNEAFIKGLAHRKIFDFQVDIPRKEKNCRHLKKIDRAMELSNTTKFKIAEVMSNIDSLESGQGLYGILLFSINMLCAQNDKSEKLIEFIDEQDFNRDLYNKLKAIIGAN